MPSCEMPTDFENERLDAIQAHLQFQSNRPEWLGIAAAFNGVAYRFRAAAEADDIFTVSLGKPNGGHLDGEERYKQENALFAFFVNATSSLEGFYYGFNLIGSILKSFKFPATEAKDLRVHPKEIVRRYKSAYTGNSFTIKLESCLESKNFLSLVEYRDMYIHRGALPRHHFGHIIDGIADLSKVYRTTIAGNPKDFPGQLIDPLIFSDGKQCIVHRRAKSCWH